MNRITLCMIPLTQYCFSTFLAAVVRCYGVSFIMKSVLWSSGPAGRRGGDVMINWSHERDQTGSAALFWWSLEVCLETSNAAFFHSSFKARSANVKLSSWKSLCMYVRVCERAVLTLFLVTSEWKKDDAVLTWLCKYYFMIQEVCFL